MNTRIATSTKGIVLLLDGRILLFDDKHEYLKALKRNNLDVAFNFYNSHHLCQVLTLKAIKDKRESYIHRNMEDMIDDSNIDINNIPLHCPDCTTPIKFSHAEHGDNHFYCPNNECRWSSW